MLRILRSLLHLHKPLYWFHADDYDCNTLPPGRMIVGGELIYATQDITFAPPSWMKEIPRQCLHIHSLKVCLRIFVHQKIFSCLEKNANWLPSLAMMHFVAYGAGKSTNRIVISGDNRVIGGLLQIYVFEQGVLVDVLERKMTSIASQPIYAQDIEAMINSLRSQYPGLEMHYCSPMVQDSVFDRFALYVGDKPFANPFLGYFRLENKRSISKRWLMGGAMVAAAASVYASAYVVPHYLLTHEQNVYQEKMANLLADNFSLATLKRLQFQQAFLAEKKPQQQFLPDSVLLASALHQTAEQAQIQTLDCYMKETKTACTMTALFPKTQDSALTQASVVLSALANQTGWSFTLSDTGNHLEQQGDNTYWSLSIQGVAP
ncbi:MAG: hypothetical protein JHC38_00795 [Thiotrichales bacterium]|nr:hypothetical protein [Thiotrichales bacterium]